MFAQCEKTASRAFSRYPYAWFEVKSWMPLSIALWSYYWWLKWFYFFPRFDFFLVSQHVRQGTVSPTHYVVVHDNSNWDVDKLQCLSYKMTHLYYNWPGTVRVPAPCQVWLLVFFFKTSYIFVCLNRIM